ncbi:hypothetical protein ACFVMC_27130 [Nocardia sp. NPDC127579]|uniref:hypothetical protein n=1 Tax=Nocardia sp. NPDC127579 TaxID=3345402 RepID=UPI0036337014
MIHGPDIAAPRQTIQIDPQGAATMAKYIVYTDKSRTGATQFPLQRDKRRNPGPTRAQVDRVPVRRPLRIPGR